MKKAIPIAGLIIVIALIALVVSHYNQQVETSGVAVTSDTSKLAERVAAYPLFAKSPREAGIDLTSLGMSAFARDGSYFLFTAFKDAQGREPSNKTYVLDMKTGSITPLKGLPIRYTDEPSVIETVETAGANTTLNLYFPKTQETKSFIINSNNIFSGSLSPDGKTYALNTLDGIKKVDIDTGMVTDMTEGQYDGAYAWLSDNTRILGFKQTTENIFEAGKARVAGIWNMETGEFEPLKNASQITQKSIKYAEWIRPDHTARINAGFDDGSFDYLVDLDTGVITYIGDTSQALMGGIKSDLSRNLFAVVGVTKGADYTNTYAVIYQDTHELRRTDLQKGFSRESISIVDEHRLLYLKKKNTPTGPTDAEATILDLTTGEETLVATLPKSTFTTLVLAPDHRTWIAGVDDKFITGTID